MFLSVGSPLNGGFTPCALCVSFLSLPPPVYSHLSQARAICPFPPTRPAGPANVRGGGVRVNA